MPDPALSAALAEAYASADVGVVVYDTLEIWHPDFSAPIRVVRDNVALDARLEVGAPRDGGDVVTFTAYAFDLVPPDQGTESVPQATLEIDNVSGDILAQLRAALRGQDPVTVIWREFLSDDLDGGPARDPVEMTLLSVGVTATRIRATVGFPDLLNRKFPGREYDTEDFPGLTP